MNAEDGMKMTPLHYAGQKGRLEMVRFLISNGATTISSDDNGRNIIHFSVDSGDMSCLEILVENIPKVSMYVQHL